VGAGDVAALRFESISSPLTWSDGARPEELGYVWFKEPIPERQFDQLRRLLDQLTHPCPGASDVRAARSCVFRIAGSPALPGVEIEPSAACLSGCIVVTLRREVLAIESRGSTRIAIQHRPRRRRAAQCPGLCACVFQN
jgi:hypothetical protein